jgi:hypothetical protein
MKKLLAITVIVATILAIATTAYANDSISTYNWNELVSSDVKNITVTQLERGFKLQSKINNRWTDIQLNVSGDMFGTIEYSSTETTMFQTLDLKRGETATIRLFEATLWLQQEPVHMVSIAFNTGDLRRADSLGYGWIFTPNEPISFVVPSNQDIKVIQAYDPRTAKNSEFRVGEIAYIGLDGGTIWFEKPRVKENSITHYSQTQYFCQKFPCICKVSTFRIGHILGNDEPTIFDALEILKYLVGIESVIDNCETAFKAALIVSETEPTIFDALEIIKYLVGMVNVITDKIDEKEILLWFELFESSQNAIDILDNTTIPTIAQRFQFTKVWSGAPATNVVLVQLLNSNYAFFNKQGENAYGVEFTSMEMSGRFALELTGLTLNETHIAFNWFTAEFKYATTKDGTLYVLSNLCPLALIEEVKTFLDED